MRFAYILLFSIFAVAGMKADNYPVFPYETSGEFKPHSRLDKIMLTEWRKLGITPAKPVSDVVFLRRIYIDLTGSAPTFTETRNFLNSKDRGKRSKLIDKLLESPDFAYYWALKWCDILRVKSEFPINLWPNAVQAYHHWVWDSIRKNKPYDQFARELLTTSGSNFRAPPANFFRTTQNRTPEGFAKVAVQAFLCSRISTWPEYNRKEMEKLFSRIAIKATDEWKEQIVYLNPEPVTEPITAVMPDGTEITVPVDKDPRTYFADWLINSEGSWFAEAAVNRVWFWFFGRGIIEPPDDFRLENREKSFFTGWFGHPEQSPYANPPSSPELLHYLADEFRKSGYDFKALCRLIANSAVYQQSCIPTEKDYKTAEKYFAVYPIRRIDAEVLRDMFTYLSGQSPKYMSVIPEPFTFIPPELPTIALADGSITSAFLENFGRPARDTGLLEERNNSVSYSQRLFLLNSPLIQWKIVTSHEFFNAVRLAKGKPREVINNIYMLILSRKPTLNEVNNTLKYFKISLSPASKAKSQNSKNHQKKGQNFKNRNNKKHLHSRYRNVAAVLAWTLVNTKEFLFRH